jgi:hypothetical protein
MKQLVEHGRTGLIEGFKKKSGEGTYSACLAINEEFKVRADFSRQGPAVDPNESKAIK